MFRKKDAGNSPKVEQSVAKAVSYEITVADMARRSERRAWWVATGSLLMSLALAGGYYYMLPLKEKVPFLVMADAYTGTATVARLRGTFQGETITTNVTAAVAAVEGITGVNVVLDVMSDEQRKGLASQLRGGQAEREITFTQPNSLTRVYAVASGKGGVGKSSVTVNLAAAILISRAMPVMP